MLLIFLMVQGLNSTNPFISNKKYKSQSGVEDKDFHALLPWKLALIRYALLTKH